MTVSAEIWMYSLNVLILRKLIAEVHAPLAVFNLITKRNINTVEHSCVTLFVLDSI